jgi:regulator of PEP synthase PpsR (kinase-PPPase family)
MVKPLTDRENFIIASVVMVVSDEMKKVSRDTRMNILQYIREKKYKSVTDSDWKEIAAGIDAHKKDVFGMMVKAFHESSANPSMSSDKASATLDNNMKNEIDGIDFDELKNIVDSSEDPKLREYYLTMKQLKRDFDDDRKK